MVGGIMVGGIGGGAVHFAFLLAVGITGTVFAAQTLWGTGWTTGLAFLGGVGTRPAEEVGDTVLGVGSALIGDTDLGKSSMRMFAIFDIFPSMQLTHKLGQ